MSENQTNGDAGAGRPAGSTGRRFRRSHALLLLAAGTAGLIAVGAALHAGERGPCGIHEARFGGWHHSRGQGPMMGRLCGDQRGAWLEDRIDLVESFVDFTPEQTPAWTALTEAARAGEARIGQTCEELDGASDDPVGRLARLETMLGAGLDVVRTVRPAFDDFYAVLEPNQRAALDRLIERRHGRD